MTEIHGFADEGYGLVADAFQANFDRGTETGAAVAVYDRGRLVVDLHAGVADATTGHAWTADTVAVGFSVTKGLMALTGYLAQQRGLLRFDDPVVSVWPEYGRQGKEHTTVRDVFAHRAGVIALDADLTFDDIVGWEPVVRAIENQRPQFKPGREFGYHALTYGWLTGEILRRATGLRPGGLIAEYLAKPLAAEAWIGIPPEVESRVARIHPAPELTGPETAALMARIMSMPSFIRSVTLGGVFPPRFLDGGDHDFNSSALHAAEVPAANGITSPTALARIYAAAVSAVDGRPRLLSDESIEDALTPRSTGPGWSGVLTPPGIRYSTGFLINGTPRLLSEHSFGHDGANGGLAFADAQAEIGFAYLNNQLANPIDERADRLTAALGTALHLDARQGVAR